MVERRLHEGIRAIIYAVVERFWPKGDEELSSDNDNYFWYLGKASYDHLPPLFNTSIALKTATGKPYRRLVLLRQTR